MIRNPQKRQDAFNLIDDIESACLELAQKFSGREIPEEAREPIFQKIDRLHGLIRRYNK